MSFRHCGEAEHWPDAQWNPPQQLDCSWKSLFTFKEIHITPVPTVHICTQNIYILLTYKHMVIIGKIIQHLSFI